MYKEKKIFTKRLEETIQIKNEHPTRIPIIIQKKNNSKLKSLINYKYLISGDSYINHILFIIKKQLEIFDDKNIYIYLGERLVPTNIPIKELYNTYKSNDGYLYISYSEIVNNKLQWLSNFLNYFYIDKFISFK